jgi:hypothetical protein
VAEDIAGVLPAAGSAAGHQRHAASRRVTRVLGKLAVFSRLMFAEPQEAVSRTGAGIVPAARR